MGKTTVSMRINQGKLHRAIGKMADEATKRAADTTQARIQADIEEQGFVRTGNFRDSIRVEKTYGPNYRVISRDPKSRLLEHGAPAHKIYPRANNRRGLLVFYWEKAGAVVYRRSVNHPGFTGGGFFAGARDRLTKNDWLD